MLAPADRIHGGMDSLDAASRALLARAPRVIDFSVNLNPYGPPPALLDAVRAAALDAYPDPTARVARGAWAEALNIAPERISVGHGAADLFWAAARALLAPGDRVLMAEPTFSEFRIAAAAAGATIDALWAREADGFRVAIERLAQSARGARALYLCTPNNPTGTHVPAADVSALARALPETTIVLDQSFLALSEHAEELSAQLPDNVICVRSLTKDFALAGLRIGILSAAPALIAKIERMRPTWSTSAPAQAAIAAAARQDAFVAESFRRLRSDRDATAALLRAHGHHPLPSASVYQLVRIERVAELRQHLLTRGILVRDCTSFGLPQHLRIAARPEADRALLAEALSAL